MSTATPGLRGVMLDITDRKQNESALQGKDRYYRALIEHGLDIIAVIGRDGTLQYESPSAERILGYPPRQRIGQSVFELVHPEDLPRVQSAFGASMETGRPAQVTEFRCRHADGGWRTLEAVGRPFVDDEGQPVGIVNCRDVTERRILEEQFRHAQKMEALGRLTSAIAHDFNNVLQTVLGSAELAMESEHSIGIRVELVEIMRAAELGAMLTRQLLAFTRRTAGAPELVDINVALKTLEGLLKRLVGGGIQVELALEAAASRVRLGKGMLEQIVMNLAVNARDAMPHGGTLRITTKEAATAADATTENAGRRVTIEVADTGSGMKSEVATRIFEPFFTTKEPGKGSGLGLSTVYGIVRDSGGHIQVESDIDQGTCFRIHLPLALDSTGRSGH